MNKHNLTTSVGIEKSDFGPFIIWLELEHPDKFVTDINRIIDDFILRPQGVAYVDRLSEYLERGYIQVKEFKEAKETKTQVDRVLEERGARYGDFSDHARLCQQLKYVMTNFSLNDPTSETSFADRPWNKLSVVQKQALEVIADKIARILSGDPNYDDNWIDIQGYAKLVQDRLPVTNEVGE